MVKKKKRKEGRQGEREEGRKRGRKGGRRGGREVGKEEGLVSFSMGITFMNFQMSRNNGTWEGLHAISCFPLQAHDAEGTPHSYLRDVFDNRNINS